jgi:hypothetical protein
MTVSILQERETSISGSAGSLSLAFASPITPGSSIHVFCSGFDTATSFTCSDSVNGSYGAALDTIDQSGDQQRLAHFKFDSTAAGTPNVTITPNVAVSFLGIWIREIGGTSGYDSAHKANLQPGGLAPGTDVITSGTQAPNTQPGLISALAVNTSANAAPTTGTGFTAGVSGWTFGGANTSTSESKRYTALTAIAATFTNGATNNFATMAAFFKEGATVAAPTTQFFSRSGPGISPDYQKLFTPRRLSNALSPTVQGSGTSALQIGQTGTLLGAGVLTGSSALQIGQTGALTGKGALAGTSALTFGQTGILTGQGVLTGTSALVFGQSGTLTQPGLNGTAALVFGQSGTLIASGVLAGSSAIQFAQTAALTGSGALAGASALAFGQVGNLLAAATLAGVSVLSFAQTASLLGAGSLTGSSALTFGASATADAPAGSMIGAAALSIAAAATPSGFGALIGNCQIILTAYGSVPTSVLAGEGMYRRKKKRKSLPVIQSAPVFIAPASIETELPRAAIEYVPDFTTRTNTLSLAEVALSKRADRQVKALVDESDDEEALEWILKALD